MYTETVFGIVKATGEKVVLKRSSLGKFLEANTLKSFNPDEVEIVDNGGASLEQGKTLPPEMTRQFCDLWTICDPKERAKAILQHRKDYIFAHLFPAFFENWNNSIESDFEDSEIVDDCLETIDYYLGKTE